MAILTPRSCIASVLGIEERHTSYLRAVQGEAPIPQPFENPLTFNEVYTLASAFIVSCPDSNAAKPQLDLSAYPALALGTSGTIKSGDTILIETPGYSLVSISGDDSPLYAAFITILGPIFVDAVPTDGGFNVVVPDGINGQSYAVLTGCNEAVTDETISAGPVIVEITN